MGEAKRRGNKEFRVEQSKQLKMINRKEVESLYTKIMNHQSYGTLDKKSKKMIGSAKRFNDVKELRRYISEIEVLEERQGKRKK